MRDTASDGFSAVAISPNGKLIAVGGREGFVRIWDQATGEQKAIPGHVGQMRRFEFSKDSSRLYSLSYDFYFGSRMRVWDLVDDKDLGFEEVYIEGAALSLDEENRIVRASGRTLCPGLEYKRRKARRE